MMTDEEFIKAIQEGDTAFMQMVRERHEAGAEKYGDFGFVGVDTIEMALEEVADLANYARYTWVKLWLLRKELEQAATAPAPSTLGAGSVSNPYGG